MAEQGKGALTEADIPAQFRQYVTNLSLVPTADELAAVQKQQVNDLRPGVKPQKTEYDIIKIDSDNKVVVWYEIDNTGLTVGARIVLFGTKYDVFKETISLTNPSISFSTPVAAGLATVSVTATVDTTQCDLVLQAGLSFTWPVSESYGGTVHLPYGIPWPSTISGSSGAAVTAQTLQGIRKAQRTAITPPPQGFIQNDSATVSILGTALWLVNAGDYSSQVVAGMKAGQATPGPSDSGSQFTPGDILIAIGVDAQAGAGVGALGTTGAYFTGDGSYGWFGGAGIDLGLLFSISAGFTLNLFWTGLTGFSGVCYNGSGGVGEGGGVTVTVYWSLAVPDPAEPSGVSLELGLGVGFPLSFYASTTYTYAQHNP